MEVKLNGIHVPVNFDTLREALDTMKHSLKRDGEYFTVLDHSTKYFTVLDPTNDALSDKNGFIKYKEILRGKL